MISDLIGEAITGSFYEKELQKISQEKFRIEKIIKRKGDKLYGKWKEYDKSFNSWINKTDLEWYYLVQKWVLVKQALNDITSYKNESILS